MLYILNVGTVPTLCILNIGTVPTFISSLLYFGKVKKRCCNLCTWTLLQEINNNAQGGMIGFNKFVPSMMKPVSSNKYCYEHPLFTKKHLLS